VLAAAVALTITGHAYWQRDLSFALFGLVFGAAVPLSSWVSRARQPCSGE
jgi:hypothetical protein